MLSVDVLEVNLDDIHRHTEPVCYLGILHHGRQLSADHQLTVGELGRGGLAILYQVAWALPFERAASGSRGELLASGRVPAEGLLAALLPWE